MEREEKGKGKMEQGVKEEEVKKKANFLSNKELTA